MQQRTATDISSLIILLICIVVAVVVRVQNEDCYLKGEDDVCNGKVVNSEYPEIKELQAAKEEEEKTTMCKSSAEVVKAGSESLLAESEVPLKHSTG